VSWDVKYRPLTFSDVLGQGTSIQVIRQFIRTGSGAHHSYLFSGPHGCGKTTLGRLTARALLCHTPTEKGDPCDECVSCQSILETGSSPDFIEIDAATNSGKDDVRGIVESIEYSSFSGRRRIYLLDEAHQLTKGALDRLLKPMEDTVPGGEDKKLVCIFCTTEPERMRTTILSRCAPAFVIEALTPETIAERLAFICQQEGVEFEPAILPVIAQSSRCHVRDAIKAVESISRLGPVTEGTSLRYLHLDLNSVYVNVLQNIGEDFMGVAESTRVLLERNSPATCYSRLAETCLLAYQVGKGVLKAPPFWNTEELRGLHGRFGDSLLSMALHFSERPGRPNKSMLLCDLMLFSERAQKGVSLSPERVERTLLPEIKSTRALAPAQEIVNHSKPLPLQGAEGGSQPRVEPDSATTKAEPVTARGGCAEQLGELVVNKNGCTGNGVFLNDSPPVTRRRALVREEGPKEQQSGWSNSTAAAVLRALVDEKDSGWISSKRAATVLRAMVSEKARGGGSGP
jgi:DNA polymerase III subunit gamma/tau